MRRIIGIDLGTTYSCIAVFNERKGIFEVLPNKNGAQTTPSVVAVNAKNEVIVGESAKRLLAAAKPGTVVAEIKRHMGELLDNKPYVVELGGRPQTPEEISAYILRDLKESAERALGEPVTAAVITVPAYFEEPQRQATIRAGQLAGLEVKRIINEPTAAAIAYGHDKHDEDEDDDTGSRPVRILIYDLGGGTFDVSLIEVERGNIRVRATHGNHFLGGVDFDHMLATWMCGQIKARYGVDIEQLATSPDRDGQRARQALNRIRADAEGYKHELSAQETVAVNFAMLTVPDPRTGDMLENVELELTRATFEAMIAPRIEETLASVDHALRDAKLDRKDVDDVVLVGGSTRIPMIKRVLTKHFGKEPRTNIHPDLCVALGAAHEAIKYVDIEKVPEPETREVIKNKVGTIAALVDVTGHSLGVGVTGGVMSVLIPRQTPMPTMRTELYQTSEDNQTEVRIEVFQGESRHVRENTQLREFTLGGLPPRPMGQVKIEITFALDSNQVLTVTARDKATGQEREIEIRDLRLQPIEASNLLPSPQPKRPVSGFEKTSPQVLDNPVPTSRPLPKPVEVASTLRPVPDRFRRIYDQAELLAGKAAAPDAKELKDGMSALLQAAQTTDEAAMQTAFDALVQCLFDVRARQPEA